MGAKGPNLGDNPPATPDGTLDAKYDVAQNAKARSQTKKNSSSPLAAG